MSAFVSGRVSKGAQATVLRVVCLHRYVGTELHWEGVSQNGFFPGMCGVSWALTGCYLALFSVLACAPTLFLLG